MTDHSIPVNSSIWDTMIARMKWDTMIARMKLMADFNSTARPLSISDLPALGGTIAGGVALVPEIWHPDGEKYIEAAALPITTLLDFKDHPCAIFSTPIYTIEIVIVVDEVGTPWLVKNSRKEAYNILDKYRNGTLGMPLSTYLTLQYL